MNLKCFLLWKAVKFCFHLRCFEHSLCCIAVVHWHHPCQMLSFNYPCVYLVRQSHPLNLDESCQGLFYSLEEAELYLYYTYQTFEVCVRWLPGIKVRSLMIFYILSGVEPKEKGGSFVVFFSWQLDVWCNALYLVGSQYVVVELSWTGRHLCPFK